MMINSVLDIDYVAPPVCSAFMRSEKFFRLLHGPTGSGKTSACYMELLRQAMQMPPNKDGVRRSRGVVMCESRREINDAASRTFTSWVRPGVLGRWEEPNRKFELRFDDVECDLFFLAVDSPEDITLLLRLEFTFAFLNNATSIPLDVVQSIMARVGRYPRHADVPEYRSFLIADMHPPEVDSFWYKIVKHLPLEENDPCSVVDCDVFIQPSGLSPEADNKENLPPGYYERLAKGMSKEWVNKYVHGLYPSMCLG